MLHGQNSPDEFDVNVMMLRNMIDTETEQVYVKEPCSTHANCERCKEFVEHQSRNNVMCTNCMTRSSGQLRLENKSVEPERRRNRRAKHRLQHCPPCHCTDQAVNYSTQRQKYTGNVEAALERFEHFLMEPVNSTIKKSQSSPLSSGPCYCRYCTSSYYPRDVQTERRRQRRRNKHDREDECERMSDMYAVMNSGLNDVTECCYGYDESFSKKDCKKKGTWRKDELPASEPENSDLDSSPEKYKQDYQQCGKTSRIATNLGPCVEKVHFKVENKKETEEPENWGQRWKQSDPNYAKLVFDSPEYGRFEKTALPGKDIQDDREQEKRKAKVSLPVKSSGLRTSPVRSKRTDDLVKNKTSTIDTNECSRKEYFQKQQESVSRCRPRRPSTVERNFKYKSEDYSTTNIEDVREKTRCEIVVKDKSQETTTISKNIYAAGDLDLHATKSHILGLIDRALSNEFGSISDNQKHEDTNQESTQQEICIEITRALQGDCCQPLAQDLLNHSGSSADYIKQLKNIRWEYMNHIHDEIRKLYEVQKFLNTYSPRQSLSPSYTQSSLVEQRDEERQHEEKNEQTAIS